MGSVRQGVVPMAAGVQDGIVVPSIARGWGRRRRARLTLRYCQGTGPDGVIGQMVRS